MMKNGRLSSVKMSLKLISRTLVLEDYPEANLKWCQSQDIQFLQFGIPGNKVCPALHQLVQV